ncbi:P-loop containing nucleoside triphosphate hydrolase protein [Suillus bovinus]|uniref:P-loop containing nucleoside triphosphate hydrolase protein n=1 Tax=Suillus bovinus TaxID=48563 RepID=UPI001B862894|nr:P-loop containing nucleoside triphosphate hydrolase protein [Suillus bovinus]KAG2153669.1 P-loop containing nucleoside triphosphate hydrolase protein [Suillus bovinus]
MSTFNVLVVGQTGCGKSSVVNILAGESRAPTSGDLNHCTEHWTEYTIPVDGRSFQIFDTIGFLEPGLDTKGYTEAIADTYLAIDALRQRGGIDLLLYCVRNEEIEKMRGHYRLFHEVFCEEDVPVALVVTNHRGVNQKGYKAIFSSHKIACVDYVCANIASMRGSEDLAANIESQKAIQELLVKCCDAGPNPRSALQQIWRRVQKFVGTDQSRGLKRNEVSARLTQRCKMEQEVAEQLLAALNLESPSSRLYRAPYAGASTHKLPSSANSDSTRDEQVSDARPSSGSQLHSVVDSSTSLRSRPDN